MVSILTTAALAGAAPAGAAPRIALDRTVGFFGPVLARNVFTMRPDGNGLVQVTHERAPRMADLPDWSPDHKRIAFVSTDGNRSTLRTIRANGHGARTITHGTTMDTDPAWSPKGDTIAFARSRRPGSQSAYDIFTVHADGSGLRRLTRTRANAEAPSWSPDGRHIVFRRTQPGGEPQAWSMDAHGSHLRRLTHVANGIDEPSWSPNGRLIAFSSPSGFGVEIFVVPAKGGTPRAITHDQDGTFNAEPTWSADSRRIVFRSSHSPPSGAAIDSIGANGHGRKRLVFDPRGLTVYGSPSW